MKRLLLTAFAGAFAAATLLSACKATDTAGNVSAATTAPQTASTPPASQNEARRVTVDELKKMLDAGQAVVYDTRAKTAYDQEHIKGALSMPAGEVADRMGELPKDKTIVFYCT
ncbi:MAG TPA: rhodanese-like domain-containing protein [Pyrinomonadaceae bacterium]|nr:rhodanese-like domain-containing protein [Pyrinomonadaceae bacterium]